MIDFPFPAHRGEIFQKWEFDGTKWTCRCTDMGETDDMKTIHFSVYTHSGIHVPAPGLLYAFIEMIGCGGGGEHVTPNGVSYFVGRGAGAGAYMRFLLTAQQFGAQRQITICPGGMMGEFTHIQKQTMFGPSWVGGGLDGNDNHGYGGYQGSFEGSPIGWSAPLSKAIGARAAAFTSSPGNVFFHEGESGSGGLCFQNQATPLPGQNGPMGQAVTLIGKGGMGHYGSAPINHTVMPDPPGWDGGIGCGGSGSVCTPSHPPGVQIVGGKGGTGAVLITEYCE